MGNFIYTKIKKAVPCIAAVALLVFIAFFSGYTTGSRRHLARETFFLGSIETYLWRRFDLAYEKEPAATAIWEGTNLISLLDGHSGGVPELSAEQIAARLFLNARLSKLFEDLGDFDKAQKYADDALHWYRAITNDNNVTKADLLKNILSRDRLQRKVF
ncbi:MAG: hypothetical protein RMK20_01345 [Verrucomicrobiales bacterium]|nr:hypothetical protein [Verrucomicrobiales bacterium]